jgi:hypothetical protein
MDEEKPVRLSPEQWEAIKWLFEEPADELVEPADPTTT